MIKYCSQKQQDKWVIEEALDGKRNGFFLDTAATDGIKGNNTYVLEKDFGWTGIAIEPNPKFYQDLIKNRECITENAVISNKRETVTMRIDNGACGGIVAEDTDNSLKVRAHALQSKKCKTIEMDAVLLEDILDKHNAPKEIDYWSLDIEGTEERVISSFNFEKYEFGCITIERPTPLCNQILQEKGYVFVKNHLYDSFYVAPKYAKFLELKPFRQVPKKDW